MQADGIMGVGLSTHEAGSLLYEELKRAGKISRRVFALCLKPNGGVFTMGGVDSQLHRKPMVWTPVYGNQKSWSVECLSLHLGAQDLGVSKSMLNAPGCLVDSGTSFIYLPRTGFQTLNSLLRLKAPPGSRTTHVSYEGLCYALGSESANLQAFLEAMPPLIFSIRNVELAIPSSQYFFDSNPDSLSAVWCLGIYDNGYGGTVLGSSFLQHHDVAFDVDNLRIGFAPSECIESTSSTRSSQGPSPATPSTTSPSTAMPASAEIAVSGAPSLGDSSSPPALEPVLMSTDAPTLTPTTPITTAHPTAEVSSFIRKNSAGPSGAQTTPGLRSSSIQLWGLGPISIVIVAALALSLIHI